MSRSDTLRRELARLQTTEASLRRELSRHEADASKARAESARRREAALRTSSNPVRASHVRSAEAEEKKLVAVEKKIADVKTKLAHISRTQASKTQDLTNAENSERRSGDRADNQRRQKEKEHAREIARLSRPTVRYVMIREPEPERLRVLYLTANPMAIERQSINPDGSVIQENVWLRTEAEVREVQNALRGSKYRDLVVLSHRPAATLQDLMDGINDVRPHVVHFSGHGGARGLLFENGSVGDPEGKNLTFGWLAEFMAATDTPPRLLVLNSCDTLDGSELILPAVPVIIAMSEAITDTAAIVFATQFYAAIASAQSVGAALRQGKAAMRAALLEGADLPQHVAREDVDIDGFVLVKAPV